MSELAHAMWTHGTNMQIEYPDRLGSVRRAGQGVDVEGSGGQENWFHFAIPTPVIVSDKRLRVGSVLVDFSTASADARVKHVHIYDGANRIAEHSNVDLHGEVGMKRFDVPDHPLVNEGIGVSIGVGFGVESMPHRMTFRAAGCDFLE